jgi:histidyl-tRNA synthetase
MENPPEERKKVNLLKPTGTNDLLPEDMDKRRWLTRVMEDHFLSYGLQQIMIPTYDFFDLYRIRSGEKIINDIFTFLDPPKHRAEENPALYALRPEFTAPLCRLYITSELMYRNKPQKYFYIGTCFRYENPSPGRYREFTQAGVEIYGTDSYTADAEMLIVALDLMEKLKIPEYLCRINDLTFLRTFLQENNYDFDMQNKIFGIIDKTSSLMRKVEIGAITDLTIEDFVDDYYAGMNELGIDNLISQLLEHMLHLVGPPEEIMKKLENEFKDYPRTIEAIKKSTIKNVCELIAAAGHNKFVIDTGIARGLDYYTNIVFEIDVPLLGKEKQVCGGGRYNNLISEFGGEITPATGFAFGFDRLLIVLERLELLKPKPHRADVFIATKPETQAYAIQIAKQIREAGIAVETDLMERNFRAVSKFLNAMKIPFMIFLGPKEFESKKLTLKDFRVEKQFENLSVEEIIDVIKNNQ